MLNLLYKLQYRKIRKKFKKEYKKLNFDVKEIDTKIEELALKIYNTNKKKFNIFKNFECKYSIFATTLYDYGGHTPCIINLVKSLKEKTFPIFLSRLEESKKEAPKAITELKKYSQILEINFTKKNFIKNLINTYNLIIDNSPEVVFIYTHPNEILLNAIISLLKKTTPMKFIFFNHASHYPNLGMNFADLILEGTPTTLKITNEKRHLYNTKIIGLQSKAKDETIYYSKDELNEIRKKFGVNENELMTISGGAGYKFFDKDSSKYFEMIKEILKEKQNLKHVIMTEINNAQKEIIDSIFSNSKEKERLIIIPLSPDYEKNFQASDLYIDSFPVSSALTQIDLMRLKTATVAKINKENPQWSFHEYMPKNYPYMYENIDDMKNGILELINSSQKREEIIEANYEFWLKTYEENIIKNKYIEFCKELREEISLINFTNISYEKQFNTLKWRNSKTVAEFFKINEIKKETHTKWLNSLKSKNPKNIAFMIYYNQKPIGVTYFHSINYRKKIADWGIYIHETTNRGKGVGDAVLKKSMDFAKTIKLKTIYLDVLKTNTRAIKLYENNGFIEKSISDNNFKRYSKKLQT